LGGIEAAGIEPAPADPDRPGTVLEVCGDIAVVVWLLGSARGNPEAVSAIHGPRLESLLEKLVDSPMRGFAYEAVGSVDGPVLSEGSRIVEGAGERWRIPVTLLNEGRAESGWAAHTAGAVADLLV
jgi:hypothetical protein